MLNRSHSLFSVTVAAALAVACSESSDRTSRPPANPPGKQTSAPAAPKGKACTPQPNWGRYWLM